MRRLLCANFFSMIHTKRLWLGAVIMVASVALDTASVIRMMDHAEVSLDQTFINSAPWLFILLPCLCGLFINTDYHDGTIRNKLTVGCTRAAVYLSNFVILCAAAVFYLALGIGTCLVIGVSAGVRMLDPGHVAGQMGLLLLVFMALTAIAVFAATMVSSRTALVACALVGLGLMFGGQAINSRLAAPKEIADYVGMAVTTDEDGRQVMQYIDKDGNVIDAEDIPMVPNPEYISEPMRSVLRTVNEIHPGGQLWEILWDGHTEFDDQGNSTLVYTPGWILALYSCGVTLGVTALGLALFGKKDLK